MDRLRIGVLGAARITGNALITPARQVEETVVTAIAARNIGRARSFAAANGIPETRGSYEALIADPDIDAIYLPLPNALHRPWTLRALQAGKHVLCEKPLTANAAEAQQVAAAARDAGRVVMEAFHYRYHPLAQRMHEIVTGNGGDGEGTATGELGPVRDIEVTLRFPTADPTDIRFSYELGGGANMDGGCYAINLLRFLGPGEPVVRSARAQESAPGVDSVMTAELGFPGGATGRYVVSLLPGDAFAADVNVTGADGELRVVNFMVPQTGYEMEVTSHGRNRQEQVTGEPTYTCQLRAFAAAVLRGTPLPTSAADAVTNMSLIDDAYRAAGLPPRGT
jgi:predicted dehydrogenase